MPYKELLQQLLNIQENSDFDMSYNFKNKKIQIQYK